MSRYMFVDRDAVSARGSGLGRRLSLCSIGIDSGQTGNTLIDWHESVMVLHVKHIAIRTNRGGFV